MALSHHTGHPCANPRCEQPAQHGHLACRGCWFSLPDALRAAIWSTWRANNRTKHSAHVLEARAHWAKEAGANG